MQPYSCTLTERHSVLKRPHNFIRSVLKSERHTSAGHCSASGSAKLMVSTLTERKFSGQVQQFARRNDAQLAASAASSVVSSWTGKWAPFALVGDGRRPYVGVINI